MSNLVLNAAQLLPVVAVAAPIQEVPKSDPNEFKTLRFLVENHALMEEISVLFKDVSSLKEQLKVMKTLSKEKQKEINSFFAKFKNNALQPNQVKESAVNSRIRLDSRWYWFGVWNLTFTKAESESLLQFVKWGSFGAAAAVIFGDPTVKAVAAPLALFLSISAHQMEASMKASKYGNFYLAFHALVPLGIHSGWNDGH